MATTEINRSDTNGEAWEPIAGECSLVGMSPGTIRDGAEFTLSQFAIEPRTNPRACTYDTARDGASACPTYWVGEALPKGALDPTARGGSEFAGG
jgi:hypothetical protein